MDGDRWFDPYFLRISDFYLGPADPRKVLFRSCLRGGRPAVGEERTLSIYPPSRLCGLLVDYFWYCTGLFKLVGVYRHPPVLLPSVIYRLSVEEDLLAGHFGEEYRQYACGTSRLLPGIW